MQNTHNSNQAYQIKFDSFGLLLADFWLTVCGARSLYYQVQLAYAPHGCTKTKLSCERFEPTGICKISNKFQSLITIKLNTNIILFNHSFGGLSPPNSAQG